MEPQDSSARRRLANRREIASTKDSGRIALRSGGNVTQLKQSNVYGHKPQPPQSGFFVFCIGREQRHLALNSAMPTSFMGHPTVVIPNG